MLAFFSLPGGMEWIVIAGVGLLIFGRRLPEVARNLGRTVVEFKRGIRDVEDDINRNSNAPRRRIEPPRADHDHDDHESAQTESEQETHP
jgi:sec-independent protein translocase protein TatA